jgi:hypothetical protein
VIGTAAILSALLVAPPPASPSDADLIATRVETARASLEAHVVRQSHPEALSMALAAYYRFQAARPGAVRNPYFFFVDFGLDNRTPRGYVFDMERLTLVDGPFAVSHGRGSLPATRDGVPSVFSNRPGSLQTSLGLYMAAETYDFGGSLAGRPYRSVGLRLDGVSGHFNGNARRRGIVSHGAPYVSAGQAGRSEGCPAMEEHRARRLLPMLANGGMVFHFSPHDREWLASDPWVNAG